MPVDIIVGSDDAGSELRTAVVHALEAQNVSVNDVTPHGNSIDYPLVASRVCSLVAGADDARGILICGSGIGMAIAANKVRGIRCAVCSEPYSAIMARRHNDANVLALGQRVVGHALALLIVDSFLHSGFDGGRHARRVALISDLECSDEASRSGLL